MHRSPRTIKWHTQPTQRLSAILPNHQVLHCRVRIPRLHRIVQVGTAHGLTPATDVVESEPGSTPTAAAAPIDPISGFSHLGLKRRNNDSIDVGIDSSVTAASATNGRPAIAISIDGVFKLNDVNEWMGTWLEAYFSNVLMRDQPRNSVVSAIIGIMGLLQRRPSDAWLITYWSVTKAKMYEFTAYDLDRMCLGLNLLQLKPPHEWIQSLLDATIRCAESPIHSPPQTANAAAVAVPTAGPPRWSTLRMIMQNLTGREDESGINFNPGTNQWWKGSSSISRTVDSGDSHNSHFVPVGSHLSDDARLHSRDPAIPSGLNGRAAGVRPINSAYDMEDFFGDGIGSETSSSLAELALVPIQTLWRGMEWAAKSVTAELRCRSSSIQIVSVVTHLTNLGFHMDTSILLMFLKAMQPRLRYLPSESLFNLLHLCDTAMVANTASNTRSFLFSKADLLTLGEWQTALYARIDGINWMWKGEALVGCLLRIYRMGMQPPAPWPYRQLRVIQPLLQLLPSAQLHQLGFVLSCLPLRSPSGVVAIAASASASQTLLSAFAPPQQGFDNTTTWFERWLGQYRTAVWKRRTTMDLLELVQILVGVAAAVAHVESPVMRTQGAEGAPSASSSSPSLGDLMSLLPQSCELSYSEWRRQMMDAVAATLPSTSISGLCYACRVLAFAKLNSQVPQKLEKQQQQMPEVTMTVDEERNFDALCKLVANGFAVQNTQLETSDVASIFSALGDTGNLLPAATFDRLLASSQPLLPDLTSSDLITVVQSLAQVMHKPNIAWQAAFCAASRHRLCMMTPAQRCSLLVAAAKLGLHLPDPWVKDYLALSERDLVDQLNSVQLANVLRAVSCLVSEPETSWLDQWELSSLPRLRKMGPNLLAMVLKALSTLHYRPTTAWQGSFYIALQRRLFAVEVVSLVVLDSLGDCTNIFGGEDGVDASPLPSGECLSLARGISNSGYSMLSPTLTVEALNSLVYSLAALNLAPPPAWLNELADAIRSKLSLLSTLDLSVVLNYFVAQSHRPSDEWWESFLEALQSRFDSLSAREMSSLLVMLHTLRVSPSAQWLDDFCDTTHERLSYFQPFHLLQILSCMLLFRHRPGQAWMAAFDSAVDAQLPRFSPTELTRAMMLLNRMNQHPTEGFMLRFFDFSRSGLAQLETQELVDVAWAVVSCSTLQPDIRWMEALVAAARPRLASLQQSQLRFLVAALIKMQRGVSFGVVDDFLAFAREFLVL